VEKVLQATLNTKKGKEKLDLSTNPLVVKQVLNFKSSKDERVTSPKNNAVTTVT
jgi:hypothetical protein